MIQRNKALLAVRVMDKGEANLRQVQLAKRPVQAQGNLVDINTNETWHKREVEGEGQAR